MAAPAMLFQQIKAVEHAAAGQPANPDALRAAAETLREVEKALRGDELGVACCDDCGDVMTVHIDAGLFGLVRAADGLHP